MSRGTRNCNPGNIRRSRVRYKGELHPSLDPAFKQFESMAWGYRAIFILLDTYRQRYGLETIRGMISRYAPPEENHTALYIEALCDMTGIGADEPLDTRSRKVMVPLVAAISKVENGVNASWSEVNAGFDLTGFCPARQG
ncbi:MAG: structural protein P5 [Alistipes sp.]|nr:structural protein P5 [Alistipes sp.]